MGKPRVPGAKGSSKMQKHLQGLKTLGLLTLGPLNPNGNISQENEKNLSLKLVY